MSKLTQQLGELHLGSYKKKALTLDEKIKNLEDAPHNINCEDYMHQFLKTESYSSLLDYVKCSQRERSHIKTIYHLQTLLYADRELRNILFSILEIIEAHFKNILCEVLLKENADKPFFYRDEQEKYFGDGKSLKRVQGIIEVALTDIRKAHEDEQEYDKDGSMSYYARFSEFPYLPFWSFIKMIPFGSVCRMLKCIEPKYKEQIAQEYGIALGELTKSLKSFVRIRNMCAHQRRLWGTAPTINEIIKDSVDFLKSEKYEYPNQMFLIGFRKRLEDFKRNNEDFVNEGYGFKRQKDY